MQEEEKMRDQPEANAEESAEEAFPTDAIPAESNEEQTGSSGMEPLAAAEAAAEKSEKSGEDIDAKVEVEATTDTPQQGCQRILVVEDARVLRRMLVKILHDAGHVCDEACQGHEALSFLRRSKATNHPYDLIITDLMMPEMDGWELIDNLIERKLFPAIPVIIITANATLDSVKRSGRLGIKNFIVKPFDSTRVLETVQKAIAHGTTR